MNQFFKNEQNDANDSLNNCSYNETKDPLLTAFNQCDIMKIQTLDSKNMENLKTSLISNYWHL